MEQPNKDSEEGTPEQPGTAQNSTTAEAAEETPTETHTEEPAEESETGNTVDEGLAKLKARLGIEPEKAEKKPDPKEKTTKEETETKKEDTGDEPDDDPEEIELENGKKLVAVTVDGITVHTTPDKAAEVKNGLLRQSDYTKKTQALIQEKQRIESEKALIVRSVRELQALQEEIALAGGFDDPEPLESEYVDPFADEEDRREQVRKYREDKNKWLMNRENHLAKKGEYSARRQQTKSENNSNTANFIKEYGQEAFEEIYPDLMEIRKALNTTGTSPFPKDMLKNYYRGKNFEKLVKAEVEKAKKTLIEKVDKNVKKSGTIRQVGTGGSTKSGDQYDTVLQKIQERSGW